MTSEYQPGLSFRRYAAIGRDTGILIVNASILKEPTPAHARWAMDNDKHGDALSLGDALHKAVLEPEAFDRNFDDYYLMSPTKGLDTKAAIEARAVNPDHILVNEEIVEKVKWMRDAVYRHRQLASLLERCNHRELSGVCPDPDLGVVRKIRVDACEGMPSEGFYGPFLLDIKTTRNIDPFNFRRDVVRLGYDVQAAFYLDTDAIISGAARTSFLFGAVSNVPPYVARIYGVESQQLDRARETYKHRLAAIAQAAADNQWCAWEHEGEPSPIILMQP